MWVSMDNFPQDWCMKIFKRRYPPINMVISDRARSRALMHFPQKVESNKPDQMAEFYVRQLKKYDSKVAAAMVLNGICGDDKIVNGLILHKLKEAQTT